MKNSISIFLLTMTIVILSVIQKTEAQQHFWKSTCDGISLPDIRIVSMEVSSTGRIFIAGIPGINATNNTLTGVFYSDDNGSSWLPTNLVFQSDISGAYSIKMAPNGYIFVSADRFYYSTDNGSNWQDQDGSIRAAALAVNSSGIIFAGTTGGGIYKSTDNGHSWVQTNNGLGNTNVYSLAIDTSGIVYAGTYGGTYRSTDNGANWTGGGDVIVYSIGIKRSNGYVFVATSSGIYLSTDQGKNWTNVAFSNTSVTNLTIDLSGNIIAIVGGSTNYGTYRSTDNGSSWTNLTTLMGSYLICKSPGYIFMGTDGGVIRSLDNGVTWIQPWLTGVWTTSLVSSSYGATYAGTLGNCVFRTTDGGNTWTQCFNGLTNQRVVALTKNSNSVLFAGTDGGGIFYSSNNGLSWNSVNSGIDSNLSVFAFAADKQNKIYAGCNPSSLSGGGIYISANNGVQWTQLTSTSGNIYSLTLGPDGKIFAGTNDGKVYYSMDSGTTWNNTTVASTAVRSLTIDQTGNIFAGTDYPYGLYLSTDNGNSWGNIGFTDVSVTSLISNPVLGIYLGTWGQGVLHSTNNGASWNAVNDGLSDYNVLSLTFDSSGYFYAGTKSSGVFRSAQPLITDVQNFASQKPKQFTLYQNYPNPFNPSTTISFSLPRSGFATLKIFDLIGREITTLVSKNLTVGNYSFKWDASNQPSGVYFYRLQAGQYLETKKLLFLK